MKIKINPLFLITAAVCCLFGNPLIFAVTYLTLIMHELVHLYFLHRESIFADTLTIEPFGICIKTKAMGKASAWVYLSAPIFNIILAFLFYYLAKRTDITLFLTASAANLALGFFNLLPFLPFDGGRALAIQLKNPKNAVFWSVTGGVGIIMLGIYLFCKSGFNFSLILTGIYIIANSFSENEQIFERSVKTATEGLTKNLDKKMKTELICAPCEYNAHNLLSSFKPDVFHLVNIIKDGAVIATVTETAIVDGIINGKTILKDFI